MFVPLHRRISTLQLLFLHTARKAFILDSCVDTEGRGEFLSFLPFALFIAPRFLPPFNPFSERPSDAPEPRRLLQTPPPPFILSALEAPDNNKFFEGRPEEWVLLAISIAGSEAGGIELPDGDDYWAERGEIAGTACKLRFPSSPFCCLPRLEMFFELFLAVQKTVIFSVLFCTV